MKYFIPFLLIFVIIVCGVIYVRRNILGFFMLFGFYLFIFLNVLGIGVEILIFLPFYIFFILVLSLFPTLFLSFARAVSSRKSQGSMLMINLIHIGVVIALLIYIGATALLLPLRFDAGEILLIIMFVGSFIMFFRDLRERWVQILLLLLIVVFYFINKSPLYGMSIILETPVLMIYIIMHSVIAFSYLALKEKY